MQIEVIQNLEKIKCLKPKWDELFNKTQPGLFINHTWVYENYRCFDSQKIILLAVYGDKKKLIGIFPFCIKPFRIKFFKFKALMHGGSAVTDYSQFLIDPEANSRLMIKRVLNKLLEMQPGNWEIFKIDNLSDNDDTANLFKNLSLRTLYAGTASTEITPIIRYDQGHEEAKKTANIKRRFKKITESCTVTHAVGEEINDALLYDFVQLHQKAYPNSGFEKDQSQLFYKALIKNPDFRHHVYLSSIRHDGKIIAAHFGFIDSTTFYYYVPTYEEQYATYGPGQYLLWILINLATDKKLIAFDFLRGAEKYKFNWTNKINTNYTLFGVPPEASFFHKILVNLWLTTKAAPFLK
jgi:CelD/BcsL family acetyltransferase involved in cellulose biosynthesis